jgi:hypothetical protein
MTVVGLHPEELFDKWLDGELTSSDRERLRAHLEGCDVCRFEYQARLDFQDEARALGASSPPPLVPLRVPQPAALAPRRRRRRLLVWGVAAAGLITASGAVASAVTGKAPWQSVSVLLSRAKAPSQPPASAMTLKLNEAAPLAAAPVSRPAEPLALPVLPAVAPAAVPETRARGVGVSAVTTPTRAPSVAAKATAVKTESTAKEPAAKEPTSAAKLFAEANQARRGGDVGRASGLYHLLQDQFPGSAEAELSRVTLSLLLLDSGDAQGALSGFERYLAGGTRGLEAEALVGRARALGRLGRRDLEATAWLEVQRKYPRSIYGRQASERLLALGQP